ncbi:MAG: bifunctional hydroxymethylpyrimidine kinase/phosphomethylpyrimidine kinase [Clostridia bacterium]|nr:bifunctional hydroxymethylpyrimidine kinase/phosphomethylpyrimidine kinase [Clostridia bacterium]
MKTALTIAGSDCSGGAGIQADIKTMITNGVYAMSAITALTAQNTLGVSAIMEVTPKFLEKQLDSVFTDIYPDAVKIGMVSSPALIEVIAERLTFYKSKNIVIDPVMIATSGSSLLKSDAAVVLTKMLFPLATIITPNIPEAEVLAEEHISSHEDMQSAAKHLYEKYGCSVLLKGGHSLCDANDVLYTKSDCKWIFGKRINNPNTHGTGCTLSSAIASNLAKGYSLEVSVQKAKEYINIALATNLNLGNGSGPLNHGFIFSRNL